MEAYKNLNAQSIVYIDDTSIKYKRAGGICKGILAFKFLYNRGWDVIYDDGNQIIMKKKLSGDRSWINTLLMDHKVKSIYRRVHRKERNRAMELL